ncbi:MAG TPA: serine/threonine-protein kinase [Thermoanaerobaculia bacterium]|nr:serine/threonine-protein kinase [Thermoanaerobaculia bacterium]
MDADRPGGDRLRSPDAPRAETATLVEGPGGRPPEPALGRGEELASARALDRYVLLEEIGRGGMGSVWAAWDRTLDRKVALKLLPLGSQSRHRATERLVREAQALARLAHPNVVAVHDAGTLDGRVFLAMELVEGESLRQWRGARQRGWREVLAVYLAAGRGLAAAHAVGLVHRDFKPENAMIGRDGRVRVLDFGLARRADLGEEEPGVEGVLPTPSAPLLETPLTRQGAVMGTPAYMTPEQLTGAPVDAASDQFSFATALWEALYGEHPFGGGGDAQLKERILAGRVAPPPAGSSVPAWLRTRLLRALSADRSERYPSMSALIAALEDDPRERLRRRSKQAALAAGAVLALAALAAWLDARQARCTGGEARVREVWGEGQRRAGGERFAAAGVAYAPAVWQAVTSRLDAFAAAWATEHQNACEATRLRGEQSAELLDLRMACLERRRREAAALVAAWTGEILPPEALEKAPEVASGLSDLSICGETGVLLARARPPADEESRKRIASIEDLLARAQAQEATARLEPALQLARRAADEATALGYRPLAGEALAQVGEALVSLGKMAEAEPEFRRALIASEAGADDDARTRTALRLCWVVGYELGRVPEGKQWLELAEAIFDRLGRPPSLEGLMARNLAVQAAQEGRLEEAVEQGRRAVAALSRSLGPGAFEVAEAANNLGVVLTRLGRFEEARQAYRQSLEVYGGLFGPDHPAVLDVRHNLAGVDWSEGKMEESLREDMAVLEARRRLLPPDHPSIGLSLNGVAQPLQNLGRYAEARKYQLEGLALLERTVGKEHPNYAGMLNNLAFGYRAEGLLDEAAQTYRRALEGFEAALGPNHPVVAYPLMGLAATEISRHRPAVAVPLYERAWRLRKQGDASRSDRASAAFELAKALAARGGDEARARSLAREALDLYQEVGSPAETKRKEVEDWLRAHGGSP